MIPKSAFEKMFYRESFRSEWQTYTEIFGNDLEHLFGEDFEHKVRFGQGLRPLVRGELYGAYLSLRDMEEYCSTEQDHRIYARVMAVCLNREEMDTVAVGDWVKQNSGMTVLYHRVVGRTAAGAIIKGGFCKTPDAYGWVGKGGEFRYGFTNLDAFQRLGEEEMASIREFFTEHPDEAQRFERQTDTVISYRQTALDGGLSEASPSEAACKFYRIMSDRTAFILNVTDTGDHIRVVYGFTEIRNGEYFQEHEVADDGILLRYRAVIRAREDGVAAGEAIRRIFDTYRNASAEELAALRDERESGFLERIHARLCGLGMSRQDSTWRGTSENDVTVVFMADKSEHRDLYSIGIVLYRPKERQARLSRCFHAFLPQHTHSAVDWQLMTKGELDALLDLAVVRYLRPMLETPLSILGQDPMIWAGCTCNRRECDNCWVEKNLFEARGE